MNVHRRACAHCGTGPDALNPGSISCCWNPVGCGCGIPAPSGSEPTSVRLRQVEAELAEVREQLAVATDTCASTLAAARRTVDKLTYVRADLGRTQKALAASQADLTRVERELSACREQNTELAALYESATRETGTEARLREVEQERDWAREVVGMLRRNEEIRAQVIRERNAERTQLHARLSTVVQERDDAERQRGELEEKRAGLAQQLAEALDDRDFIERELTASHAQLAAARLEIDQLRAERQAAWELAGHTPDREEPTT